MSETTNLRQADAKVEVVGIVSENTLEELVIDGKKLIKGQITIQTGDINFITFNVYVNQKKNDGTDNGTYPGIKTVMEEYQSIAKVGKDNATKVYVNDINGQIRPRSYVGRDGQIHVGIQYQTMFFNRYEGSLDDFEPHAWFELEMTVASIIPETYNIGEKQGEETGRVIVKGWMPTYNGIEPMTLIAPAEDGIAEAILEGYLPNQTVKFLGDIVNSRAEFTEEIPTKIGKPRTKKKTIYKNEMIITNASEPYGEESEAPTPQPYDLGAISQAITDRELRLEEEQQKAKKPETSAPTPTSKKSKGLPNF